MATFTKKEICAMAVSIISGLASNPAGGLKGDSYDIEMAMKNALDGIEKALLTEGHTITNDPFQSAVIDAGK